MIRRVRRELACEASGNDFHAYGEDRSGRYAATLKDGRVECPECCKPVKLRKRYRDERFASQIPQHQILGARIRSVKVGTQPLVAYVVRGEPKVGETIAIKALPGRSDNFLRYGWTEVIVDRVCDGFTAVSLK